MKKFRVKLKSIHGSLTISGPGKSISVGKGIVEIGEDDYNKVRKYVDVVKDEIPKPIDPVK